MADTILSRFKSAWNAFKDPMPREDLGLGYSTRPDRVRFRYGNERSIVTSLYNRIGIDVSALSFLHARVEEDMYVDTINSGLNTCLTSDANIDQTGRAFIQDVAMSMCDEGAVAIVAVDTTEIPNVIGSFDVQSLRTGKILDWYPKHVRVSVYNERSGQKEEIVLSKKFVAVVENPLYSVMNEPNSTLQRLISKLNMLDIADSRVMSGKLDLIFQVPYTIKTDALEQKAEKRRKSIEDQLSDSAYGVAYVDGTEKVTQLNRPAENSLLTQIEFLTRMLYGQLGITEEVFLGTADEATMLNYYTRTIDPIAAAISDSMKRRFLTKTAKTQGQSIIYLRDPFKLVPASEIADIADKFTRNEIFTSNEVRGIVGRKPSKEKSANELRNKNLNAPEPAPKPTEKPSSDVVDQNGRDVNREE